MTDGEKYMFLIGVGVGALAFALLIVGFVNLDPLGVME